MIILYPLAKKIPEQLFINPINRFIDLVSNNSVQNEVAERALPVELEVLEAKIFALLKTATEHERNKAAIELGHLSARVAHDIRSPLAAMQMGLYQLTKIVSQKDLVILNNGIQCVRDIANNVLERYRNPHSETDLLALMPTPDDGNVARPILLFTLVEIIISQKRHEWIQKPCELMLTVSPNAKISWVTVAPNEVKRLLSNLLNNAYDALLENNKGIIQITLNVMDEKLHLQLHDNGVGIPAEKISDVLSGVSLKHIGKGLGLSIAKQYMENITGSLDISSTVKKGTIINLIFPRTQTITWFPDKICLHNATIAIVLDDDFSMLMYWQQRLSETGLLVKLFSTYNKAMQWLEDNQNLVASAVFLADYELTESTTNGLMFLEKINDNNNRYLITSYAEELYFQRAAEEAGVWLIPKSLASEIALVV